MMGITTHPPKITKWLETQNVSALSFSFVVCSYKPHFSARQRQFWFSSATETWLNSKKLKKIYMDCKHYLCSWFLEKVVENSANFGLPVIAKILQKSFCGFLWVFVCFFLDRVVLKWKRITVQKKWGFF